jgi:hypothetical protein
MKACRHPQGAFCKQSNPGIAQKSQYFRPPPKNTADYQIYLKCCGMDKVEPVTALPPSGPPAPAPRPRQQAAPVAAAADAPEPSAPPHPDEFPAFGSIREVRDITTALVGIPAGSEANPGSWSKYKDYSFTIAPLGADLQPRPHP